MKPQRGVEGLLYFFFKLGSKRGWVVKATPRQLNARQIDPVIFVQGVVWATGPAWTGVLKWCKYFNVVL
jgi:hypothetical protein